mgnify:CR=1 FL=1
MADGSTLYAETLRLNVTLLPQASPKLLPQQNCATGRVRSSHISRLERSLRARSSPVPPTVR